MKLFFLIPRSFLCSPISRKDMWLILLTGILTVTFVHPARAQSDVLPDNLKVLRADPPTVDFKFISSGGVGQMFLPGEKPDLKFDCAKSAAVGISVEIQEITTRDPNAFAAGGNTVSGAPASLIALNGPAITASPNGSSPDGSQQQIEVKDLPLPEKFGTYALIVTSGTKRTFLCTLARVPQPRADGTVDNVPIFGEGSIDCAAHPGWYARMGIRGWRNEASWNETEDGKIDWTQYDKMFKAAKDNGCQIMITMEGSPPWAQPFNGPTPAVGWDPKTGGYGGTGDWLLRSDLYPRYGKWIEAFVARYWEGGKGGLWGVENFNEPWEGGGISGWASDIATFRKLQMLVATSAKKVDPNVRILGDCSFMNTEDKLYSDGTDTMSQYIDIFTDHYVAPCTCFGPEVAASHGKTSMETETWFASAEYMLPQVAVQFLACGQKHLSPWAPQASFDSLPGNPDPYVSPTPLVVATAAFNYMLTGKPFEKMVFQDHLPFAFQFGKDDDKDGLVVLFGQLMPTGSPNIKTLIWAQVNGSPGGTITIDNQDGLLQFFDLAGNPQYVGEKSVTLPLNFSTTYIKSAQGPAAVAGRLNTAKIEGKRFVEIVPHDFNNLPTQPGSTMHIELRNRLNIPVTGTLKVTPPDGLTLNAPEQSVTLNAGESRILEYPFSLAQLSPANAYPCKFDFSSAEGNASYAETLNAAVAPKRTIKVDGDLSDWADVPGVNVIGSDEKTDVSEQLRRPWLEIQKGDPTATSAIFKMAWDDNNVYVCAQVNDPTPEKNAYRFSTRDDDSFFHNAADDNVSPYKEFIQAFRQKTGNQQASFAEVPYVYKRAPGEGAPEQRDHLQIAFDTIPGWHGTQPVTQVPQEFHAYPDTDYEYSLYWVDDQQPGTGELWRMLAPGVPRMSSYPRQPKGARTTGTVPGSQIVVKREASGYIYEASIPKSELAELKLQPGTSFGFTFLVGNSEGLSASYGDDKAITKRNGLSLHPYYENRPNDDTRWTLIP